MAARTAVQRRVSSVVEIGVFRRSLSSAIGQPLGSSRGRGARTKDRRIASVNIRSRWPAIRCSSYRHGAGRAADPERRPEARVSGRAFRPDIGMEVTAVGGGGDEAGPDDEVAEALVRLPLLRI